MSNVLKFRKKLYEERFFWGSFPSEMKTQNLYDNNRIHMILDP